MPLSFTVVTRPRSLNGKGKLKSGYAELISSAARKRYSGDLLSGALYSRIIWFHKYDSIQGDIDNIAKRIHDALKGVVYSDDRIITHTLAIRVNASQAVRIVADPANAEAELELAERLQAPNAPDVLYIEIGRQFDSEVHLGPVQ
jgi:Holliday junction resolvase RusA-like endonuclease